MNRYAVQVYSLLLCGFCEEGVGFDAGFGLRFAEEMADGGVLETRGVEAAEDWPP